MRAKFFQTSFLRRTIVVAGLAILTLALLNFYEPWSRRNWAPSEEIVPGNQRSDEQIVSEGQKTISDHQSPGSTHDILNATLGFHQVFAINIPSRTDKRDQLVLGSSITGFDIHFLDGVDAKGLNPKTYPFNWKQRYSDTEYACLRAHLNVAQRIVRQGLRTSLVLEDDADWDISIKRQLQAFAHAIRTLQGNYNRSTTSPHGDDWDILWLGHCGASCNTKLLWYMIPNDPTLPMVHHLPKYYHGPPEGARPATTRLVCPLYDAACTQAYAISYVGAQRLLAALSVNPSGFVQLQTGEPTDIELSRMCKSGLLRCFSPFPSLVGTYRSAGLSSKGTDQNKNENDAHIEPATSQGLVYSTMLNIKHILQGERVIHSTWPDVEHPTRDPEDLHLKKGSIFTYQP